MKKLLLSLALVLWPLVASAQCVSVGGATGPAPQPGITCASEPTVDTYAASGIGIVPAASATDVACLSGSATKIIRLQFVRVSGTGTAITIPVKLNKNASLDTGGTAATGTALPTPAPVDSTDATVTATATAYTANPTVTDSTPVVLDIGFLGLAATTATSSLPFLLFDYQNRRYSEAPTLRTAAQQFCLNLNATSPTASLSVSWRWTEQAQ
jgi:hypothetical protein